MGRGFVYIYTSYYEPSTKEKPMLIAIIILVLVLLAGAFEVLDWSEGTHPFQK